MPEVREVFRLATQKVRPDAGFMDRQYDHRRKQERKRKIGAFAVAGVIGVTAVALFLATRGDENTITPGQESEATSVEVATGFVEAFGALEADQAMSYLAEDADISGLTSTVGAEGMARTPEDLRVLTSWLKAMGYKQTLTSCEESGSPSVVSCAYDFHALRSDEIGLGPFSGGSFSLTVLDGEIVRASQFYDTTEFSPQVWEPFANWVSTNYPEDAAVMYEDDTFTIARPTPESIRLWERRTRDYVEEVAP